jgi:RNA recognition motif-containing protein
MTEDEAAEKAIAALNGKDMNGRALNVNEARPKTQSGGGARRGGRGGFSRDDDRGSVRQRREPRW